MKTLILLFAMLAFLGTLAACSLAPAHCTSLMTSDERNFCILNAATTAKDAQLCRAIPQEDFRTWCYTSVGNATNDPAACDGITNAAQRGFCKQDVLIENGRYDECASLENASQANCYDAAARASGDWRRCLNLSFGSLREACIEDLARQVRDPNGCLALQLTTPTRDDCLFSLSISANDSDTCAQIVDPTLSAFCTLNVAVKLKDLNLCSDIGANGTAYLCRSLIMGNATLPANFTGNTTG